MDALTLDEIPAALALSTQAGWNQTPEDWRRLLALSPDGCFAGRLDGRLVATATSASPAPGIRWIGMVLVDESCRGQGLGTRMLERALERTDGIVGLDATDLGRPLYLKLGFQDVAPIDRWGGALGLAPLDLPSPSIERILEIDAAALGVDRSVLLRRLASEPNVKALAVDDGYALLRPGREHLHLGPIVARDPRPLLRGAARAAAGRTLIVDVPRTEANEALFREAGLTPRRRLMRMTRGTSKRVLLDATAAVAFEWG